MVANERRVKTYFRATNHPPSSQSARRRRLAREEADMIGSVAADCEVTQVVDGTIGIHGMIPKAIFAGWCRGE
jgi:hypothetical protein